MDQLWKEFDLSIKDTSGALPVALRNDLQRSLRRGISRPIVACWDPTEGCSPSDGIIFGRGSVLFRRRTSPPRRTQVLRRADMRYVAQVAFPCNNSDCRPKFAQAELMLDEIVQIGSVAILAQAILAQGGRAVTPTQYRDLGALTESAAMADALVVELHAAILRESADITVKHYMGLRQLERDQNRRRLVAIGLAFGVVRHITSASSRCSECCGMSSGDHG